VEKRESSRIKIDGGGKYPDKELAWEQWYFTADEINRFKLELRKSDPQSVDRFIGELEFYCQDLMNIIDAPTRADHKAELESTLKAFKKSLAYLNRLEKGHPALSYKRSLPELLEARQHPQESSLTVKGLKLAWQAKHPLEQLSQLIEAKIAAEQRGRGRPEHLSTGLAEITAQLFAKYIGEPKTTKYGAFDEILKITFEAVGLPSKAISHRLMKSAIEKLT
jgi:hypothetical protein